MLFRSKAGMIFAFGSDIHYCHGTEYWTKVQKKLKKYYDDDAMERVLVENAKKMIDII